MHIIDLSEDPGSTHDQNMSETAVNLKKLFEQVRAFIRSNFVAILWLLVIAGSMYYYASLMVGG